MRTVLRVAIGIGMSVAACGCRAACDGDLTERLTRAQLTPAQMEIVCGRPETAPPVSTSAPAPALAAASADAAPPSVFAKPKIAPHPMLENHYPTSVGFTKDSDDVLFLDANISLRYPFAYQEIARGGCNGWHMQPYFAFTGRFGQYLRTRDSSPVVLKAFNPEFLARFFMTSPLPTDNSGLTLDDICKNEGDLSYHNNRIQHPNFPADENDAGDAPRQTGAPAPQPLRPTSYLSFVDVYYGHLSDGQGISDPAGLAQLAGTLGGNSPGQSMEFARDYISRGWDYFGAAWTGTFQDGGSLYARLRKYVGGFFQQQIEETPWEDPQSRITRLQQVNGIYVRYASNNPGSDFNYTASLETGAETPGRYNTLRLEGINRVKWFDVPLKLWYQQGYNSDLAQYYKFVRSAGFAFQFTTFNDR